MFSQGSHKIYKSIVNSISLVLYERNYYSFGLPHRSYNENEQDLKYDKEQDFIFTVQAQAGRYKYRYNGKEWQEDLGLNRYDYGARSYLPELSRFTQIDPLAEKYVSRSLYVYAVNNPSLYADILGMGVQDIYIDENGNYLGTDGAETKNVRVVNRETWENVGARVRVTNSGIEVTSFGDLYSFATFTIAGGWGFQFPKFIQNKTVGKNGTSLAHKIDMIEKQMLRTKLFTP